MCARALRTESDRVTPPSMMALDLAADELPGFVVIAGRHDQHDLVDGGRLRERGHAVLYQCLARQGEQLLGAGGAEPGAHAAP